MGVSSSAVSRVTGVDVKYKNFNTGKAQSLPQRLAIIGVGNTGVKYSLDAYEVESAAAVGDRYGYGSPLHLAVRQLFPVSGDTAEFPVTVYPLAESDSGVAAAGSVGLTGTAAAAGSGKIYIGGIAAEFSVTKGELAADILAAVKLAIGSIVEMPVTAGTVADGALPLTSKFKGTIGNLTTIVLDCSISGLTWALTAMANGAGDPDVSAALANINTVWETVILDTLPYTDTSRLDKFYEFGAGRWGVTVKKPCIVAHGCTDDYATRSAVTDIRPDDYINFLIESVGSRELPYVIAAKGLISDIMTTANNHPARGYKGTLSSLQAGDDSVQESYATRNLSVQKGASTNDKSGSAATLNDIITFYHPTAEGKFPCKRYVCDLMKLMNVVYNVRLIQESDDMKGVTLVSDDTVTTDSETVQPKTVKGYFMTLADSLAGKAIIQEPKFTKKNMTVEIDSENPKRLNITFPVKLSGNVEIASTEVYFGFYLGGE